MGAFEINPLSKQDQRSIETTGRRSPDIVKAEYNEPEFIENLRMSHDVDVPVFKALGKWWEFKIEGARVVYWQLNKLTPSGNFDKERLLRD